MKTLSQAKSKLSAGVAMNVLRLAANVAEAETIIIGADTYEIDIINTDSTVNTVEAILADGYDLRLTFAGHLRIVGDLIRIENEIMRVKQVIDSSTLLLKRGDSGTTIATHVTNSDIFISVTPTAAGVIAVGLVTTLTPTAASAAIVDVINSQGTQGVTADAVSVNEIVIRTSDGATPRLLACTETLAGVNNAWAAAAMYGSVNTEVKGVTLAARAANATEVALDHALFNFPFTVGSAMVQIRTSAGALKTWDGAITFSGRRVTVTNGGATDWAATDVITVLVSEA